MNKNKKEPEMNKNNYDNNVDYFLPYHWTIREHDFFTSGVMYFGYLKIIDSLIKKYTNTEQIKHLDIGCGDGRATLYFNDNNPNLESTGIDLSDRAIAYAKLLDISQKVNFTTKNLFEIDEKYNLISMVEVLEHIDIDILENFLKHVNKILLVDGLLILSVPSLNLPTYLHKGHIQHFSENSLRALLGKSDFEITQTTYQHNMNYSFFLSKNLIVRAVYKLIKNKFYTLNIIEKVLYRIYYKFWNIVKKENDAARIIMVCKKINRDHNE